MNNYITYTEGAMKRFGIIGFILFSFIFLSAVCHADYREGYLLVRFSQTGLQLNIGMGVLFLVPKKIGTQPVTIASINFSVK